MRNLLVSLAFLMSMGASAAVIDLNTVTERAKKKNYTVLQNAEMLYQSKMTMVKSRTDLLPSLNLWDILNSVTGFEVNLIEDLCPFLIPSNWFRKAENELLYQADKLGYRALVANEVMNARAIYWRILHDQDLVQILDEHIKELDSILEAIRIREEIGVVPVGTTRELKIRQLGLKDDWNQLRLLYQRELLSLTMALGYPAEQHHIIRKDELKMIDRVGRVGFENELKYVLALSPELQQFDYFVRVIPNLRGEVYFAIMGAGKASRGLPGGVFDSLPTLNGLGFSQAPVLKIIASQERLLKLQRDGVRETLKRQWQGFINEFTIGLERRANLADRIRLTNQAKDYIEEKIKRGESLNLFELLDISRSLMETQIAYVALQYHLRAQLDIRDRLQFQGGYRGIERL
ncbi:MAG: hypothetical protein RJB66_1305 [Pseudomonadota bacterium]|jgi:hypothetical protein